MKRMPYNLNFKRALVLAVGLVLVSSLFSGMALAADPNSFANPAFVKVWNRTDKQVDEGSVARSFLWGPRPFTTGMQEDYAEAPGGKRLVQYFDKSRMELTNPNGDPNSPYYVTNGLLAVELMTGRLQLGDTRFEDKGAANIGVAGDPDDTGGPTYQALGKLMNRAEDATGILVAASVDRDGNVRDDVGNYGKKWQASYAYYEPATGHNIAGPFWYFLNQSGPVINPNGQRSEGRLFDPLYYATGLPVTEAYWAQVKVGGQVKDVLVQAFERRVLTFTPTNSPQWQVEMGNVGQHYYRWRYDNPVPPLANNYPGKLVYSTKDGIFVVNPNGSAKTKIADGSSPLFSPDGQRVAFITRESRSDLPFGDQLVIQSVKLDGSDRQIYYSEPSNSATGLVRWSPDGQYIALYQTQNGPGGLYLLNLKDGSLNRAKSGRGDVVRIYDWSADGKNILWQAGTEYADQNLYYGNPAQGGTALTNGQFRLDNGFKYYIDARISPDGKTVAIGGTNLFFLAAPGQQSSVAGKIIELGQPTGLAWSPDGQALAVSRRNSDNSGSQLLLVEPGNGRTEILAQGVFDFDWSR